MWGKLKKSSHFQEIGYVMILRKKFSVEPWEWNCANAKSVGSACDKLKKSSIKFQWKLFSVEKSNSILPYNLSNSIYKAKCCTRSLTSSCQMILMAYIVQSGYVIFFLSIFIIRIVLENRVHKTSKPSQILCHWFNYKSQLFLHNVTSIIWYYFLF